MKTLHIAAAVIINAAGQTLLVRKGGTQFFMQPGGKIDAGETPLEALQRELHEELNLNTHSEQFSSLGPFQAVAANEADHHLNADLFLLRHEFDARPAKEIAEARWLTVADAEQLALAPLTRDTVMHIVKNTNEYS